ncbi:MAG: hypothetical protein OHK0039_38580 [Bacteroidia bacterium]
MFHREYECPSCGAPIRQTLPGSRSLACTYCGQTSHINADSLEAVGSQNLLIDYGSSLSVGMEAQLDGRDLVVLGRLRFDYDDGFWDEWYVQFTDNGNEGWIQEDDGSFVLFHPWGMLARPLSLEDVRVGRMFEIGDEWPPIFVVAKSEAHINGGEGELPFRIVPGEQAHFVEGLADGRIVSIELLPSTMPVFAGTPFGLEVLVPRGTPAA